MSLKPGDESYWDDDNESSQRPADAGSPGDLAGASTGPAAPGQPSSAPHPGPPAAPSTPIVNVYDLDTLRTIDTSCHCPTILRYLSDCTELYLTPGSKALALLQDLDDLVFIPSSPGGKLPYRHSIPSTAHAEVLSKAMSFAMRWRKDCGKLTQPLALHGENGFTARVVDLVDAVWKLVHKLHQKLPALHHAPTDDDTPASKSQKRHDLICAMIYTMLYYHHLDLRFPEHNGELRAPRYDIWLEGPLDCPTQPPLIICWCRPSLKDAEFCEVKPQSWEAASGPGRRHSFDDGPRQWL